MNKKILVTFVCSALLMVASASNSFAQKKSDLPPGNFLQSSEAIIQLGIWDKYDDDRTGVFTFVVTDPRGKQYKAIKRQSVDDWVFVNFPGDFSPVVPNQGTYKLYSWKCYVSKKVEAQGHFRWGGGKADDESR